MDKNDPNKDKKPENQANENNSNKDSKDLINERLSELSDNKDESPTQEPTNKEESKKTVNEKAKEISADKKNINEQLKSKDASSVEETNKKTPETKSISRLLTILLVLIVVLIGVTVYLYFDRDQISKENEAIRSELSYTLTEKEMAEFELLGLLTQYDSIQISNLDLMDERDIQKSKIEDLIEEIKKADGDIKKFKNQVYHYKSAFKDLAARNDSLQQENMELTKENFTVKKDLNKATRENKELITLRDSLSSKVAKGSVIKTLTIDASGINKNNKPTTRSKKTEKIRVCFTLRDNPIAPSGNQDVYLRLFDKDNKLLTNSESDFFVIENKELAFTQKRQINYQNKELEVCVFWKPTQLLEDGKYITDLFMNEHKIGTSGFTLK